MLCCAAGKVYIFVLRCFLGFCWGCEDIYEKLRRKIDESPFLRLPRSEEIIEILKLRFTPEETEIALHLPCNYFEAMSAEEVAEKSGKEVKYVREVLERLVKKGSIFWLRREGVDRYSLMPVFGFFEIPFSDGRRGPVDAWRK